jgi:hypothetical protein
MGDADPKDARRSATKCLRNTEEAPIWASLEACKGREGKGRSEEGRGGKARQGKKRKKRRVKERRRKKRRTKRMDKR